MIVQPALSHACPKCRAPHLARKELRYPVLGYSDFELACFSCGLYLWQRPNESPRQTYYRWLMDRFGF